jgi:hypothetical protein
VRNQASQKYHMPTEQGIPTTVLRFPQGGLNLTKEPIGKEEEEANTEESEEDKDSNGTCPHKVNTALGPKRAPKALHDQKRARLHKSQPSAPPEGIANVPATIATPTNVLPSTMPTTTIEASSIELGICTSIRPDSPSVEDFISQLEAKEAIIAHLQENDKKLFREIEDKSLEIAKQALEIQQLRRQQSHALTVDDV